jgi:hypothetical protein
LRRRLLKHENHVFLTLSSQIFFPMKKLWLIIFRSFISIRFCLPLFHRYLDKTTFGDRHHWSSILHRFIVLI